MPFEYQRTIRFADTDAAGVVFFANTLRICHEAYEESLAAAGIELAAFFSATAIIIPISRTSADYLRPLRCGDRTTVRVAGHQLDSTSFAIDYEVVRVGAPAKCAARVRTEHVCVSTATHARLALPEALQRWLAGLAGEPAT